jgi:hypothetical protein
VLPIDPKAQAPRVGSAAVADTPAARPLRVLVVDDNDDGREMLLYFSGGEAHTVAQAPDGRTLETAAAFHSAVVIMPTSSTQECNGGATSS